MKIKIIDLDDVREVQEILRDLGIKQSTYGYSDIFNVPDNEDEYVFDILKKKNIKWKKMTKNESKLSNIINRIIKEEVVRIRLKESDRTRQYDGFVVLDRPTKKSYKFKYLKGTDSANVENQAISKLMKKLNEPRSNFMVHGFVKKGEWDLSKAEIFESRLKELTETKILMSGQSSFMKKFAVPQFKKAGIQFEVDDDGDILEIRAKGDEKSIEKIGNFLETKDSNGDYGGWFLDESRLRESTDFELKIYNSGLQNAPEQFKKLPKPVLDKIEQVLEKLHFQRERADDYDRSRPQSYYNGVNSLQNYIVKEFSKIGIKCSAGEGDDEFIELMFESRLRESSSQQEIEDIAIDLIDYLGKQLPTQGWSQNKRIMGFFQDQGLTDMKVIQKIYKRALQLNRE